MPSPIIALDLISTAMRHIGVIATGETLAAEDANAGLRALNDVLETWSIEQLAVYGSLNSVYATVAGQAMYTLGSGGNWNDDRPMLINDMFTTVQGVDFPVGEWSYAQYDSVAVKYQQQQIVERYVFINDSPLARVILYPTPSMAVPITVGANRLLTQIASTATVITLPPGYARALQYAVAAELAPQYGSPIDVTAQARSSIAIIKRANRQPVIAGFDSTLLGRGPVVPARGY